MRLIKEYRFGDVQAFETGRAYLRKKPLMSVFSYLVDGVMIDTGIRHARNEIMQAPMLRRVHTVCLTHHHEDHSGNAAEIRNRWGAPIFGHPLCVEKMSRPFPILPYQRLLLGKTDPVEMAPLPKKIESDNAELAPIHTPGHSRDHVCYLEPHRGWLFSGDINPAHTSTWTPRWWATSVACWSRICPAKAM